MRLRPATPADVPFLTDVVVEATRDQGRLPDDFDEESYRRGFAQWSLEVLEGTSVIEVDGEPAGRLRVERSPGVVELAGIQLLPRFQSQGIGTRIIRGLIDEARAADARLELLAEPDNPRARALYERLGFVPSGRLDDPLRMHWQA